VQTPDGARVERGSVAASLSLALRDPVVAILMLAGIFDGLSGNPIHSILLLSTGIALGRDDALGRDRPTGEDRATGPGTLAAAGRRARWLLIVATLAYAFIVGGFARYSWPATVAVVIPGAIALVLAWRDAAGHRSTVGPIDRLGAVAWASVFVAAGLWELTALLLQPSLTTDSAAHPTISVLTDPILATHPGRSIALLLWVGGGWFIMQR
jgi:hypothetical protein